MAAGQNEEELSSLGQVLEFVESVMHKPSAEIAPKGRR